MTQQLLKLVEVRGKPLRGLLWCDSAIRKSENSKQGAFINRDVNAAMNILICARQEPQMLDRRRNKLERFFVAEINLTQTLVAKRRS